MALTNIVTLTDLGSPAFAAGSAINMQEISIDYNVGAQLANPALPGRSGLNDVTPNPVDNLGNTNPRITINGFIDRTTTHDTNITNNTMDFDFIRGFAETTSDKQLDVNAWETVDGSQFIVQILSIKVNAPARSENAMSYTVNMIVQSGT